MTTKKNHSVDALVLTGGLGTRLRGIVDDRPKGMADIAGKPFLEWLVIQAREQGVRRVILCTGYLSGVIEDFFGDGARWGVGLSYSIESSPLGTGGALRLGVERASGDTVLVLNGDSYCKYDLGTLLSAHGRRRASATILLAPIEDCRRFGSVSLSSDGSVISFAEKADSRRGGLVNTGVYVMQRQAIEAIDLGRRISLEQEVLPRLVGNGLYGLVSEGPFIDIGTPESYAAASEFIRERATD